MKSGLGMVLARTLTSSEIAQEVRAAARATAQKMTRPRGREGTNHMPYDEGLAERIRGIVEEDPRIREKKMFGGLAFLVDGRMSVGIIRDELMVRVGPDAYEDALSRPHARPMDFTGRPMRGFVQVAPAGFEGDAGLSSWVALGIAYAETQPAKATR